MHKVAFTIREADKSKKKNPETEKLGKSEEIKMNVILMSTLQSFWTIIFSQRKVFLGSYII